MEISAPNHRVLAGFTDYLKVERGLAPLSGLRHSDLVGMNISDIHWSDGAILVRGKGSKQRVVPFGESASAAITAYLPAGESRAVTLLILHGFRNL